MSGLTEAQRVAIYTAGRSYMGVKWIGQGRNHMGVDCIGLQENAYIEGGMPLERTPPTYRGIDSKLLMGVLAKYFRSIPFEQALPADLIIYRMIVTREAHLGMLTPPRGPGWPFNMLHCPANQWVQESIFDRKLGDIGGFYTWR